MNLTGVIDRLDDWINPIVVKELRQAVKSRLVIVVLLLFLLTQLVIVSLFLAFQEVGSSGDPASSRAGGQLFMVLQAILLGTCMVLIPLYASVRLSNERSDTNVDLLFISTLRPTSIIVGKFFSALVLAMLVFSCCAPFMTFTYLLRGIDIPSILLVLSLDLMAIIPSTQAALFLASIPASRPLKMFLFFGLAILLCFCFAGLMSPISDIPRDGVAEVGDWRFWVGMGAVALTDLLLTGLFFCWSVALISPPSANRAVSGRIFLVGTWLILGGLFLALTWLNPGGTGNHYPMIVWMGGSVILFCVQFLISINERDSWGPRVARTIPRWWGLRALAFLFYSGSAGGVLLSVLCAAVTLLVSWGWRELWPSFGGAVESDQARVFFLALALYTFCYGMSAVVLRSWLLSDRIRSVYNWVLAALLLGLGSSVPWVIFFLIHFNQLGRIHGFQWWELPNPFAALYHISSWPRESETAVICFLFLVFWAVVLLLPILRWMVAQMGRFRPPVPRVKGTAREAEMETPAVPVLATPAEAR